MRMELETKCLELLEKHGVPENVIRHSLRVRDVAVFLAEKLNGKGEEINIEQIESGALLHDIAKIRTLETGEDHGLEASRVLREEGFEEVAEIAEKHMLFAVLKENLVASWEEKIVWYADKRVDHDKIVSLEKRFQKLVERYAGNDKEKAIKIKSCLVPAKKIEKEIFSITGKETEKEIMSLAKQELD